MSHQGTAAGATATAEAESPVLFCRVSGISAQNPINLCLATTAGNRNAALYPTFDDEDDEVVLHVGEKEIQRRPGRLRRSF